MPVPNFLTPKNFFIFIMYQFVLAFIMFIPPAILNGAARHIFNFDSDIIFSLGVLFMVWLLIFGKANKHTANDNISGVITLVELIFSMTPEERADSAFVFFDYEEAGLFGSSAFEKAHRKIMKDKLLINFDCVSDGDYIMLVQNKQAYSEYDNLLREAFQKSERKIPVFEKSSTVFYPSDQANFKKSIAVASFNRNKYLGYYIDKIHTDKDRVFDRENIYYIVESIRLFSRLFEKRLG